MIIPFRCHHRYLIPFSPKRVPHYFTDVLIVGTGISGCRAALELDPAIQGVMLTKGNFSLSNSSHAQGGIAGALDPEDDIRNHANDTIEVGVGLCDEQVVREVVGEAPERIRELVKYGAQFDLTDGDISLTREGGHSHSRVAHALGDATGREIMRALTFQVKQRENLQIWEETFVIDLLTSDQKCCGAVVWNARHGKTLIWAKQTILAAGGSGCLYRETTNPSVATGDGHAIAFRAGAELRDMEFMQFHPTVLYIAGSSRYLISEAVRGEGAYLVDSHGVRFMEEYHEDLELAPRDEVSRAITSQMEKTRHPSVYLDFSPIKPSRIEKRFPHIGKVCQEFGLDIKKDLIPVRPGAHYMLGGVTIDHQGRTTLPGLWAAGEATSSGLHGANRLASNSLLEGLVFGRRVGQLASEYAGSMSDTFTAVPIDWPGFDRHEYEELNLSDVRNSLTSLMWRNMGIRRDAEGLQEAEDQVAFWDRYVSTWEFRSQEGWELQNMLIVARLMIAAAKERTESRGTHFRNDFPEEDPRQAKHIALTNEDNGTS